jgi:hypothetical protein
MHRKNKNFLQQEKESEDFLKKVTDDQLTDVTKQRKKTSSITYHKFELIKYLQEINLQQKKIEEELSNFSNEKTFKNFQDEEEKKLIERLEYRKGIQVQVEGFKSLVSDLKNSLQLFEMMAKEGKKDLARQQWESRKLAIFEILQEIKQDFQEREDFLLIDFPESDFSISEDPEKEDMFLMNLPSEVPG